jgi:hypothetical protein
MQRITTSAALVLASALLLSGCAADGGGEGAGSSVDACTAVVSEVRDISNGAQNALAAGGDPSETQSTLEGYSERVMAIDRTGGDDTQLSDALDELDAKIQEAAEFAATLPSDPDAEVDADAVAEHQTAIQDAASAVGDTCTED